MNGHKVPGLSLTALFVNAANLTAFGTGDGPLTHCRMVLHEQYGDTPGGTHIAIVMPLDCAASLHNALGNLLQGAMDRQAAEKESINATKQ